MRTFKKSLPRHSYVPEERLSYQPQEYIPQEYDMSREPQTYPEPQESQEYQEPQHDTDIREESLDISGITEQDPPIYHLTNKAAPTPGIFTFLCALARGCVQMNPDLNKVRRT